MKELVKHRESINGLLARYGVKFGVYKDKVFHEQLFPFDTIPRVISKKEFEYLEKGLIQRVTALNKFLADIYGEKRIVEEGIIPEEFIYSSKGYLPACEGILPPQGIYSHISGIDLVQARSGTWYILEDNLRVPSGASYPMIAREMTRRASPTTFANHQVVDNRDYGKLLKETMDHVNVGGINVIMTPGRYNAAFFEHTYLAEQTGAVLATCNELVVKENTLYFTDYQGEMQRVGAIYRRISDEYLDPMAFLEESLIGIPHLMEVYRAGRVAIINAPGNGIADDKGIYYFVPKMIEYYLGEEPILKNAPTYLPYYKEDFKYILDNLDKLVIKDVSEAGGYGVVFGRDLDQKALETFKETIINEPRRFIAQEVIDFIDLEVMEDRECVERQADSFVVNSSQGGGFKDTWVLSE